MCPELSRMLWLEMIPQGNAADSDEHPTDDRDRERTFVQGLCGMLIESCLIYNDFWGNSMHDDEPIDRAFQTPKYLWCVRTCQFQRVCNCVSRWEQLFFTAVRARVKKVVYG